MERPRRSTAREEHFAITTPTRTNTAVNPMSEKCVRNREGVPDRDAGSKFVDERFGMSEHPFPVLLPLRISEFRLLYVRKAIAPSKRDRTNISSAHPEPSVRPSISIDPPERIEGRRCPMNSQRCHRRPVSSELGGR